MTTNLIRRAREERGISVRQLASTLGVSPSAVVGWERAERKGVIQVGTLERALTALEERLTVSSAPTHPTPRHATREARVSLELHRAVIAKLMVDPDTVLSVVEGNVIKQRGLVRGERASQWLDRWQSLAANRDIAGLVQVMLDHSQDGIDMRQCTPFAGVLTHDERVAAITRASARGD